MNNKQTKQGFTLIELLVVVLIIGILAAVALPQYQLAVDKSRFSQALIWAKNIKEAENVYYLANGTYTKNLEDLDIDFSECKREDENYYLCDDGFRIGLYTGFSVYVSSCKKMECAGIEHYFDDTRLCYASTERFKKVCKSMGATAHPSSTSHFILP